MITRTPQVSGRSDGRGGPRRDFGGGIAFDRTGTLFGLLNGDDGNLWTVDAASGVPTMGRALAGSPNKTGALLSAAAFDCDGTTLYSVVNDYGDRRRTW